MSNVLDALTRNGPEACATGRGVPMRTLLAISAAVWLLPLIAHAQAYCGDGSCDSPDESSCNCVAD